MATNKFVGTWLFDTGEAAVLLPGETLMLNWPDNTLGQVMYDDQNNFSAVMMVPSVKGQTPTEPSPIDYMFKPYVYNTGVPPLSFLGCEAEMYLPYYGTYEIKSDTTIDHLVTGSLFTSWMGQNFARGYEFLPNGDLKYIIGESWNIFKKATL